MDITGRIALITGSGQGIGRGIATTLAKHGASVAMADLNLENAIQVRSEVAQTGQDSIAIKVDVTNQTSINRMLQNVVKKFGKIDILVNNAGIIAAPGWEEREDPTEKDWQMVYEVNIRGVSRVTETVAPLMKTQRYGKIINISSGAGRRGSTHPNPSYNSSKAAVISITQSVALELAPFNINVNAICPGPLWTPMADLISYRRGNLQGLLEAMTPREIFDKYVAENVPLGRPPLPEDIGNMVAFLASDYAKNITGQTINVNGGSVMN